MNGCQVRDWIVGERDMRMIYVNGGYLMSESVNTIASKTYREIKETLHVRCMARLRATEADWVLDTRIIF